VLGSLLGSVLGIYYIFGDINQDLRARSTRASVLPSDGAAIRSLSGEILPGG
jgi:hypothetical protein